MQLTNGFCNETFGSWERLISICRGIPFVKLRTNLAYLIQNTWALCIILLSNKEDEQIHLELIRREKVSRSNILNSYHFSINLL